MRPRAGPECTLGLRLGLGLGQREVWGTEQGAREVLDQELWRQQQPPYVPHKVK